jgi:hypothetical protein
VYHQIGLIGLKHIISTINGIYNRGMWNKKEFF